VAEKPPGAVLDDCVDPMSAPHFPGLGPDPLGNSSARPTGGFPGLAPLGSASASNLGPVDGAERRVGGSTDAGPPLALLSAAVIAPIVTVPLLFTTGWGWHVLGWAVATLVTAALLIVSTLQDTRRRASAFYLRRDGLVRGLRGAALVLALLAAAAHAWLFADWFARLPVFAA
jgi:hypothetical protein